MSILLTILDSTTPDPPAQFAAGDWAVADPGTSGDVTLTITGLPNDGGSAITALQYTTDAGSAWNNLSGTGTGARTLSVQSDGSTAFVDDTLYTFAIRAVNAVGNGSASGNKTVTPTNNATTGTTALSWGTLDSSGDAPINPSDSYYTTNHAGLNAVTPGTYGPITVNSATSITLNTTNPSAGTQDVGGFTFEIRAGVKTVATIAEIDAAQQDATLSGDIIEMRPGTYELTVGNMNDWFNGVWSSMTTIRPTTQTLGDVIGPHRLENGRSSGLKIEDTTGPASLGFAEFQNMVFYVDQNPATTAGSTGEENAVLIQNRESIGFVNCLMSARPGDETTLSWAEGGNPRYGRLWGVQFVGAVPGCYVQDCEIRGVMDGIVIQGNGTAAKPIMIERNQIHELWGDAVRVNGDYCEFWFNDLYDFYGDYCFFHQDGFQFFGGDHVGIVLVGNLQVPGLRSYEAGFTHSGVARNNLTSYFMGSVNGGVPFKRSVNGASVSVSPATFTGGAVTEGCAIDVIADTGAITVTLNGTGSNWGTGKNFVIRRHPLSNHDVTVVPGSGVTFDSGAVSSVVLTSAANSNYINFDANASSSNWVRRYGAGVSPRDCPTYQGLLHGDMTNTSVLDMIQIGNAFFVPNLTGLARSDPTVYWNGVSAFNLAAQVYPDDYNGDGLRNQGDGLYVSGPWWQPTPGNDLTVMNQIIGSSAVYTPKQGTGSQSFINTAFFTDNSLAWWQTAFTNVTTHNTPDPEDRADVVSKLTPEPGQAAENKGPLEVVDFVNRQVLDMTGQNVDAPALSSLSPVNGATGVATSGTIEIRLSKWFHIDPATLDVAIRAGGSDVITFGSGQLGVVGEPGVSDPSANAIWRETKTNGVTTLKIAYSGLASGTVHDVYIRGGIWGLHKWLNNSNDQYTQTANSVIRFTTA